MKEARSHYPQHLRNTATIPYQNIVPVTAQVYHQSLTFNYQIKTTITRKHFNPPLWTDAHSHDFEVALELEAVCHPEDLYGLDMVEMENRLRIWAEQLPDIVNNHPLCPKGTTEELCLYFSRIPMDDHIKLMSVSVAETPNRATIFNLGRT